MIKTNADESAIGIRPATGRLDAHDGLQIAGVANPMKAPGWRGTDGGRSRPGVRLGEVGRVGVRGEIGIGRDGPRRFPGRRLQGCRRRRDDGRIGLELGELVRGDLLGGLIGWGEGVLRGGIGRVTVAIGTGRVGRLW